MSRRDLRPDDDLHWGSSRTSAKVDYTCERESRVALSRIVGNCKCRTKGYDCVSVESLVLNEKYNNYYKYIKFADIINVGNIL